MSPSEVFPAGKATVSAFAFKDLMSPVGNLPVASKPDFYAGKALANQPWITAPSITDARDGLGPLYNARSCLACHQKGGRGKLPVDKGELLFGPLVRLSVPSDQDDLDYSNPPEPTYGKQVQTSSIALNHQLRSAKQTQSLEANLPPEADIYIEWQKSTFTYPDGMELELRKPIVHFENLGYGPMQSQVQISLRNAPMIAGVGLLEAIAEEDILALTDPSDINKDGISGRANRVWDQSRGEMALGRFGLKSNRASVLDTVAAAFAGDIGLSNPVYPSQPCTSKQEACLRRITGNDSDGFELPMSLLTLTNNFILNIGVPKRDKANESERIAGRSIFYKIQCSTCHTPSFTTRVMLDPFAHLSQVEIWPYTDLLLHDMGAGLSDNRPDYKADGREWRTAPLWGLVQSKMFSGAYYLLHDGRARSVQEAVLWHGGEAEAAKNKFINLSADEREQLIKFVESL